MAYTPPQGTSASQNTRISGDGRYVIYQVDDGTGPTIPVGFGIFNESYNVYAYDRFSGITTQVNAPGTTAYEPSVSSDGRYVAYRTGARGPGYELLYGISVVDRTTGVTTVLSAGEAARAASSTAISGDGRFVAFVSNEGGLILGDPDINANNDIFVWDRTTGALSRLTDQTSQFVVIDGLLGPRSLRMSADGSTVLLVRYVMPDRAQVLSVSRATGAITTLVDEPLIGGQLNPRILLGGISADGSVATWSSSAAGSPADTNGIDDIFVRAGAVTTQITNPAPSTPTPPDQVVSYSADVDASGRYVSFISTLPDPGDTSTSPPVLAPPWNQGWLYDRLAGTYSSLGAIFPVSSSGSAAAVAGTSGSSVVVSSC